MKTNTKRLFALITVALLLFSLTACSDEPTVATTTVEATTTTEAVITTTADKQVNTTTVEDVTTTQGDVVTTGKGLTTTTTKKPTTENAPWRTWVGTTTIPSTTARVTQGTSTKVSQVTTTTAPKQETPDAPVESSSHSVLLTYLMGSTPVYMSKSMFASCVGYYPDGDMSKAPVDTMFDTFALMSSNTFQHDASATGGIAVLNKARLEDYYECEFKSAVNLDALNAAVGELKSVLNRPNYKVNVFLPYYIAHPDCYNFGEVNGKNLDLSIEEDRLAAMEWQLDEQVRRFEEKGYEHIQILGFYMVVENVFVGGDVFDEISSRSVRHFNQYAASKGYEVMVNPFNSIGTNYADWKDVGYSRCAMQINHFPMVPDGNGGFNPQMNTQGIGAFKQSAEAAKKYDMGLCMEWSCLDYGVTHPETEADGVMYFKRYMDYGIKYGYMNLPFLSYQIDGGPASVYDCIKSDSAYVRSIYDEMYKFIKCTLTEEDIRWYEDFR